MKIMKRGKLLGIGLAVVAAGAGAGAFLLDPSAASAKVTVYKSPTCGCCGKWEDHLRKNGFEVESVKDKDMNTVKIDRGVPRQLASCHTAVVGGYVVEGHVPADVVQKLLAEKPEGIIGITVPGMPIGSPGMEGPNPEPYQILTFDKDGNTTVFAEVKVD